MSMTYYAVTDDPNELAHFGVLGMKWGVRHDKPRHSGSRKRRSAAYKKAQSKLGRMMKSGIKKAEAHWKEYNSPRAKEERFMKKAMEKARTGTLKYGKLTDDQVRRVTERLALERNARQLGSTENPSYSKRIKTAIGEGVVRGLGMGTASYIDARMRGRGETTAAIKRDKRMAKYENSLAGQRKQRRQAKAEARKEYYKTQAEEGNLEGRVKTGLRIAANTAVTSVRSAAGAMSGLYSDKQVKDYFKQGMQHNKKLAENFTQSGQMKRLEARKAADKEAARAKAQQDARDRAYYTNYGKMEAEREFNKLPSSTKTPATSASPTAIVRRTPTITHKPSRDRSNRPTVTPRPGTVNPTNWVMGPDGRLHPPKRKGRS